jgi:phage FluMu gp28-like protein
MSKDLKQAIKREYLKCADNPVYFMKKYCTIQHPTRGKIKFNLYDFQENMLTDFKDNRYNIILKSRQLGISTLSAGYSLWTMLFHADKNVLVIAKDKDTAKNLVTKVRVMYAGLPQWLKTKVDEDNKLSLRLSNGSQIKAVAATSEAGRSEALSLLVIDEAAFIENIDSIWTAAQQTLATGGNCIALSTPNGVGNWFHQQWMGAEDGTNNYPHHRC